MPQYVRIPSRGFAFVFATEPSAPELLHIWARHMVKPEQAADVWFDSDTCDWWNAEYYRWESWNATHMLYWLPGRKDAEVFVITCFRLEEEESL